MQTLANYTQVIRNSLNAVLCLRDFPSEIVEKQIKPEVEISDFYKKDNKKGRHLLLNPIIIARNEKEKCYIEPSINSVRISFCFKKNDEMDTFIAQRFCKFFAVRAELFEVVRKKPIEGYDISFLVTNQHLEKFDKEKLIEFIIEFVENVEKDINEIKLNIITQTRVAATFFVNEIVGK